METSSEIKFTVYGKPEAQGSTRAFVPKGWTRPIVTSDNKKMKPWRQEIARTAIDALNQAHWTVIQKEEAGVRLTMRFFLARPVSLPKKMVLHVKKPDVDKLVRAAVDSLTGIAFEDDAQVCQLVVDKNYGSPERLEVRIIKIPHAMVPQ